MAAGAVAVLPASVLVPAAIPAAATRETVRRPVTAVPAAFEDQQIVWLKCLDPRLYPGLPRDFYRMQCGSFRAPADWTDPDSGESVSIAVSRLPSSVRPARGVT